MTHATFRTGRPGHTAGRARACAAAIALALALGLEAAQAQPQNAPREAAPASADPVLEARVQKVAGELRCLVCQNETIAASHADLAVDLRNQVREMLRAGKSEREVFDYMTARYGDFVLYRPPVKSTTALLWAGPPVLLAGGLLGLWWLLRRRNQLPPEQFEADDSELDAPPTAGQAGATTSPTHATAKAQR